MYLHFDGEQLQADIKLLKEKGVSEQAAENIAQFKQAVEYAVWFQENFYFIEEDEASEEIRQCLEDSNSMLENVWEEISPIFEAEKAAVRAAV